MGRMPWQKWFPSDYLLDTRSLSLAAKGAWSDLLNTMMAQNRGSLALTWVGYSRLIGATVDQTVAVIAELVEMGVCDGQIEGRALHVTDCNKSVTVEITLISRRLKREESQRKSTYDRVKRFRERERNALCNVNDTDKRSEAKKSEAKNNNTEGIRGEAPQMHTGEKKEVGEEVREMTPESYEEFLNREYTRFKDAAVLNELRAAYPAIDVVQSIAESKRWLLTAPPSRRKWSIKRYVENWLKGDQHKATFRGNGQKQAPSCVTERSTKGDW